ncbi:MAG: ATP-binding protein, partial [Lachnospiraceae bacterium]|nr:ATP-binding protein [Lachnospiraceae bacterium]
KADKQKIQQVLHNLIDNAIKFSNEDSKVEVTVTAREGTAYVSVRDYGIGIPKESLNQVWERFYKTDLSRGKDKKGTGLGLSITKQIINAHNEKIVVESTVGEGTEFTFTLRESERAE